MKNIKTWQYPFLWILWFIKGTTIVDSRGKLEYSVVFRGVNYIIGIDEL